MNLNSISCGQGAPSLFLIVMAGEGLFPADVVIVADTGWENDMLWSTGERTTAREFFERVTKPLAAKYGIDAVMVRTLREDGTEYGDLQDEQKLIVGKYNAIDIPMYGTKGGRLNQSCTSKWKVQGIRQEMRRRGAKTSTTYMGIHRGEVHRVKPSDVKWDVLAWPLLDIKQNRDGTLSSMGIGKTWDRVSIASEMERRSLPYIISTECDGCPHKDWNRWNRTSPETIRELTEWEAQFEGHFFLTRHLVPLDQAIEIMRKKNDKGESLFDVCDSGYCFV